MSWMMPIYLSSFVDRIGLSIQESASAKVSFRPIKRSMK